MVEEMARYGSNPNQMFYVSTSVPTLIITLSCLKCFGFRRDKNVCHLPPDLFLQMRTSEGNGV